jgi:hypothetical protein
VPALRRIRIKFIEPAFLLCGPALFYDAWQPATAFISLGFKKSVLEDLLLQGRKFAVYQARKYATTNIVPLRLVIL